MIVLGADTHKRSHTIAAVSATTAELVGEQTVQVSRPGFGGDLEARMMSWQRGILRIYGTSEEVPG